MGKINSVFIIVLLALTGCTSDPVIPTHADNAANKWIYETMQKVYLYNYIYPPRNLNYDQSCESFFQSILSTNAADNDGKWRDGKHTFYSRMSRTITKTSALINSYSYGFEYAAYDMTGAGLPNTEVLARVLYVAPDSPADKAGLKRGDWIYSYNGTRLTSGNYGNIASGTAVKFIIWMSYLSNNTIYFQEKGEVNIPSAANVNNDPVLLDTVYTSVASGNVGYIVYNRFSTGPDSEGFNSNGTYVISLKEAFSNLKSSNIQHLIIDLRYNPGGYIECTRILGSLISQRNLGRTFATLKYNSNQSDKTYAFLRSSEAPQNVGLDKVYILTSSWTASASELLINTLRPYDIEVVIIGDKTEGKNVGSQEYSSSKYGITLEPIVCQLYNSLNESNYKDGFYPDYSYDEFQDMEQLLPLGDIDEPLLRAAISSINGIPPVFSGVKSKSGSEIKVFTPSFIDKGVLGAVITE